VLLGSSTFWTGTKIGLSSLTREFSPEFVDNGPLIKQMSDRAAKGARQYRCFPAILITRFPQREYDRIVAYKFLSIEKRLPIVKNDNCNDKQRLFSFL
jgi:hypothetical protein